MGVGYTALARVASCTLVASLVLLSGAFGCGLFLLFLPASSAEWHQTSIILSFIMCITCVVSLAFCVIYVTAFFFIGITQAQAKAEAQQRLLMQLDILLGGLVLGPPELPIADRVELASAILKRGHSAFGSRLSLQSFTYMCFVLSGSLELSETAMEFFLQNKMKTFQTAKQNSGLANIMNVILQLDGCYKLWLALFLFLCLATLAIMLFYVSG